MNKTWIVLLAALLIPASLALEITLEQPEPIEYNTTSVDIEGSTDNVSDSIEYILDNNGSSIELCNNCTTFNSTLENLAEGNHTLTVTATLGNETAITIVNFSVVLPVEEPVALEITINKPDSATYNTSNIDVDVETNTNTDLYYELDNDSAILACENCTEFNQTLLNLTEGEHTLRVFSGNVSEEVTFTVDLEAEPEEPVDLEITIHSPENETYDDDDVLLNVTANTEADLYYELDNESSELACLNCTEFTEDLEDLDDGDHTVRVFSGNVSISVDFVVNTTVEANETDDDNESNETGEYRFDIGFNKLPQALESGEIDNEYLREVLENNKLNPGILNRLAKTGMLDNETINLITETQFTPRGILQKLLGWLITDNDDVAESLFEEYNLTEEQQASILTNTKGLSKGRVKQLTKEHKLGATAIDDLLEAWDDEDVTETVAKHQTMTKKNIDKAIAKGLEKKEARSLVENQVLDEKQQDNVAKQWGKDKKVDKSLKEVGKKNAPGQNKVTSNAIKSNNGNGKGNGRNK